MPRIQPRRLRALSAGRALLVVTVSLLMACVQTPVPRPVVLNSGDWDAFVTQYLDAYFAMRPDAAVWAGRHEFDGRLPDWSAAGLRRQGEMLRDLRQRAMAFDSTGLDARQRFERAYLIAQAEGDLFWLERADIPHRNPAYYINTLDPDVYLGRNYAPLATRMRAYVAYARALPAAARHIRSNLRTPMPRTFVDRGKSGFAGYASFFSDDVPKVFAAVDDPQLQADFRRANDSAAMAFRSLAEWFESQRASATEDFVMGTELFREMLWATERVDVPLAEVERVGRADLERNLAALRSACERFAPGQTPKECTRRVQANKSPEGPVNGAIRQLATLRQFLDDKNLVSIPGTEQASVAASPPYNQANLAYINIPGPYETNLPSTYYISPPDPAWSEDERKAYVSGEKPLLFVSVHEVWPGHFLQFLHANRARSKFGQVFVGYAFAEGWAHYTEEMMWDAGLGNGDAETHIGQLMNALLRNVRYLSAIGLHTGSMTVAESERMFLEQAFQDPGNARQQAARGTYDPAYLNYTMGKLMIRKLREDWTSSRGGRNAWKEFHDTFLSYGGPPIPLVRAAMQGAGGGLF